jgi:hypothetical protein
VSIPKSGDSGNLHVCAYQLWYDCGRMYPTLRQQRQLSLSSRNESLRPTSWIGRHLTRQISPYVTWVFLRLGISANQCTLLRVVLCAGAGAMFVSPDVAWWMAGIVTRYATIVLDCVDGELSRLRSTSSPEGSYLDDFAGHFCSPLVLGCMSCGLYRSLGGFHVAVVGLAAMLGLMLTLMHLPLVRAVAYEWAVRRAAGGAKHNGLPEILTAGRRAARYLLVVPGVHYLPHVLVVTVLDAFVGPFTLFGFLFNARLVWMALFALGSLSAAAVRAAATVKWGLRAQL